MGVTRGARLGFDSQVCAGCCRSPSAFLLGGVVGIIRLRRHGPTCKKQCSRKAKGKSIANRFHYFVLLFALYLTKTLINLASIGKILNKS
jgi:hypothetical protein